MEDLESAQVTDVYKLPVTVLFCLAYKPLNRHWLSDIFIVPFLSHHVYIEEVLLSMAGIVRHRPYSAGL